jgi:hypothetical protein
LELSLSLWPDVCLKMTDAPASAAAAPFPTARLARGWRLVHAGEDLAEEAVGFGFPAAKRGLQTIFPGAVELGSPEGGVVTADFLLNLEEKIGRPGAASVRPGWLYSAKNLLAGGIRQFVPSRRPLTALSNLVRRAFAWETRFEPSRFAARIRLTYSVGSDLGRFDVRVEAPDVRDHGVTEVIVMNEQGAHAFDAYRDSDGLALSGTLIGCWDEVRAESASFLSAGNRLGFTLRRVAGARLYRGREMVGSRLAWAGFGYSFPPAGQGLSYSVQIERLA